jgi:predicted metal-dependent peptidase
MLQNAYGNCPKVAQYLVDIFTTPKLNWRQLLADFVQRTAANDYDWNVSDRTYINRNIYVPSPSSEELNDVVFVRDISGSISDKQYALFCSEFQSLLLSFPVQVHLLDVSCVLVSARKMSSNELDIVDINTRKGYGGTSFVPAFEWVEQQDFTPVCLIYLTDCLGKYPTTVPDYPVLWVCSSSERYMQSSGHHYYPPFGETIFLEEYT